MTPGGTLLPRRLAVASLCSAVLICILSAGTPAQAATNGASTGKIRWSDVTPAYAWANQAIDYVGATNDWMRDYKAGKDGRYPFKPAKIETRAMLAVSMVRAFAPAEPVDPTIVFDDIDPSARLYRYANVAVKLHWMGIDGHGNFGGDTPITMVTLHKALVRALGLAATAASIDAMHMTNGTPFKTPKNLGTTLLGMRLGLRYNNADDTKDVLPGSQMSRAQVAYSLFKAATLDAWVVPYLEAQYADMTLPNMVPARQAIVEWGLKYVGYPYVWGGEWGFSRPEPSALGGQPVPGFDCSGFAWWLIKSDDGGAWNVAPPRPYGGWNLPQRVAADQAGGAPAIKFDAMKPGDLAFYDGEGQGIDHVDVYIGNGWALDSSSSVGGVTVMWVGDGWYFDHFVHGRRMI
jgi:cell wall-associated NlpC family hydrolase